LSGEGSIRRNWQARLLNILIGWLLLLNLGMLISDTLGRVLSGQHHFLGWVLIDVLTLPVWPILYGLNRHGHTRPVACVLVGVLVAFTLLGFGPTGFLNMGSEVALAVPIVMSSFVIVPAASFVVVALILTGTAILAWLTGHTVPAQLSQLFIGDASLFGLLALVAWFSARGMQQAQQKWQSLARENARLHAQARAAGDELRLLAARVVTAQEMERQRVARALHDQVSQELVAHKVNLDMLLEQAPAEEIDLRAGLEHGVALVEGVMARMRELALELRPPLLDDLGLEAALRWYTTRFSRTTGIPVSLDIADTGVPLPPEVAAGLFRICQEALENVARHAQARSVKLSLKVNAAQCLLSVIDDGVGFDPAQAQQSATVQGHVGLTELRERAMALGGKLAVRSAPGEGTEVCVTVPLPTAGSSAPHPGQTPVTAASTHRSTVPKRTCNPAWEGM